MLDQGQCVLQTAGFQAQHGELGVQRRDLLVGSAEHFDGSCNQANSMHWFVGADEEVSKETCDILEFADVVLSFLIEELKAEDGRRLLEHDREVIRVLGVTGTQERNVQAKIQLRVLQAVHKLD